MSINETIQTGKVSDPFERDTKVKISNNTKELTGFTVENFQYSTIGKIILYRLLNNRDIKMLITSSGNTTGTGKTQLAIIIARIITKYSQEIFNYEKEWSAKDNSFIDVYEYLEKYEDSEKGEVLLTDELEYLADKRRSLSHENVHFSQAWQMLRYKNVITIATCPSMANLDMRIAENTDIWININFPGFASPYYVSMDDFTGEIEFKRLKQMGFMEIIRWKAIDDDKDYIKLSQEKEDIGIPGISSGNKKFNKEQVKKEKKEVQTQTIEEITTNLLRKKINNKHSLTQEQIANIVNRSQQYVSKIKRNLD